MAGDPEDAVWITRAEHLAETYGLQGVVLFTIHQDGTVRYTTYGADRRRCDALAKWIKAFIDKGLSIWPFRTHFGWGNGGVPMPLTEDEKARLSPAVVDYITNAPAPPSTGTKSRAEAATPPRRPGRRRSARSP